MELLQLRYFYAVAQNQHVTKTAEQLHIAQPALTQSIRRLEKELGVPLFRTSGRNIVLTEYGQYLKEQIAPVLSVIDKMPDKIHELANIRKKTVKINVLAATTVVTAALIAYKKQNDGVNFQIMQNSNEEEADITIFTRAFFQQPVNASEIYKIFTEHIFMAVPKNSPYTKQKKISLSDIANEGFISLAGSRSLRAICDRYCMHSGFSPKIVFESDSTEAVKDLIGGGLGIGFWPHYTWGQRDMEQVVLLPISEPNCQRDIVLQLHNQALKHEEAVNFFSFLSSYFETLRQAKPA